jgi:rhodanese-related sulfurtransferase
VILCDGTYANLSLECKKQILENPWGLLSFLSSNLNTFMITKPTEKHSTRSTVLVIALAVFLGLLPLGIYGALLGSAPQIHAAAALEILAGPGEEAALVDVRPRPAYQERHIAGAISLPLDEILNLDTAKDLPAAVQNKTLLLVCDAGLLSARASRHLSGLGISAYSVRGGMQDWGRAWPQFKDSPFSRFELAGGVLQEPFRAMTPGEQVAAALALLWVKPTYMLLSATVSILLLRRKATDLRILGGGLLVFLIGEVFCAINYVFLKDNSYFAEYMHSYSMAIAFGLAAYALLEGLDQRLIHFTQADRRCAMLPICGPCVKYQAVRCGIRRIAQLLGVAVILLAVIPLLSPFSYTAYNTQIGMVTHYYVRPLVHQWFEARYSPLAAIVLVTLALFVLQLTPRTTLHPLARALFCAGVGFFGFAMFRVTLGMVYAEALVWATFWEELTELMFVAVGIYVLWVFQHSLLMGFKLPDAFKFGGLFN